MKALLLALLATAVALHTGSALQCYSCEAQVSNKDCLKVKNCSQAETQCWTSRIRAAGLVTIISKGCSSDCVDAVENYYLGRKNVTCCSTNLCNASGARGLQPATALGLLAALGSLLLWGPGQL